jgi:hypothetical protein
MLLQRSSAHAATTTQRVCRCERGVGRRPRGVPTLFQLQVQHYPIRPDVAGPKSNIQVQATPTIPALLGRDAREGGQDAPDHRRGDLA